MLEQIANVGELLSGIGVIVSLLFVGFQIRQNSSLLRRSANREMIKGLQDIIRISVEDAEFAEIVGRFETGYAELDSVDKQRVSTYFQLVFQQFELINEDYKIGNYDDEPYEYFAREVGRFCSTPGGKIWWDEIRLVFTPSARRAVEEAVEKYGDT